MDVLKRDAFIKKRKKIWIFRSGGSLELTMSRQVTLISKKSINSELHNMVQYPDNVKHSGIPNRSSKIA